MNKNLRIKLNPVQPYFLGGERIFEIGSKDNPYFIKSLEVPTQTTLFGILRYMGVLNPIVNVFLDEDNIGKDSFHLMESKNFNFGKIKKISPIYIMNDSGEYFIPTPYDNSNYNQDAIYTPFSKYIHDASNSGKLYPEEYSPKKHLTNSWCCITKGENYKKINKNLFEKEVRVAINTKNKEKSFFKKEHVLLKKGNSFVFFAEVEPTFDYAESRTVTPGFYASIDIADEPSVPDDFFGKSKKIVYAQSDIYLNNQETINSIYNKSSFVFVDTKNFKGRTTNKKGKNVKQIFKRYDQTITLIKAGSIFLPKDDTSCSEIKALITKHEDGHPRIAGFNHIL